MRGGAITCLPAPEGQDPDCGMGPGHCAKHDAGRPGGWPGLIDDAHPRTAGLRFPEPVPVGKCRILVTTTGEQTSWPLHTRAVWIRRAGEPRTALPEACASGQPGGANATPPRRARRGLRSDPRRDLGLGPSAPHGGGRRRPPFRSLANPGPTSAGEVRVAERELSAGLGTVGGGRVTRGYPETFTDRVGR